jgi:hypothetical protein
VAQRPLLRSVDVASHPTGITATVELGWDAGDSKGVTSGVEDDRPDLVARATLRALEDQTDISLRLLGTNVAGITTESVAVTVVQVRGSLDRYAGSAVLREGEEDLSVARSVLDSLNRYLTRL